MANEYFNVRTSIINKKKMKEPDIDKHFNGYITIRWLLGHPKATWEANRLNTAKGLKYISSLNEYKTLKGLINIPRNTFIKTDKTDKHKTTILDFLMEKYSIGKRTANNYFNILGKDKLLNLIEPYARRNETHFGAKEMDKLKKIREAITYLKSKRK